MANTARGLSEIPLLAEKHSGIPGRLLGKARDVKSMFMANSRVGKQSQRSPVIPQGIQQDEFFRALDELSSQLGAENVEIVDRLLDDGWYVTCIRNRKTANRNSI